MIASPINLLDASPTGDGAAAALAELHALENEPALRNYYLLPSVTGRMFAELGDHARAAGCYRQALERPCSEPERRFLRRQLEAVLR